MIVRTEATAAAAAAVTAGWRCFACFCVVVETNSKEKWLKTIDIHLGAHVLHAKKDGINKCLFAIPLNIKHAWRFRERERQRWRKFIQNSHELRTFIVFSFFLFDLFLFLSSAPSLSSAHHILDHLIHFVHVNHINRHYWITIERTLFVCCSFFSIVFFPRSDCCSHLFYSSLIFLFFSFLYKFLFSPLIVLILLISILMLLFS